MNLYNAEGYIDLTAYEALSRIEREERRAKKAAAYRPLVYICSPYSHGCIKVFGLKSGTVSVSF